MNNSGKTPNRSWSVAKLKRYLRSQYDQLLLHEKKAAIHVHRLGAALVQLKARLKHGEYGPTLKKLGISATNAWRAVGLFKAATEAEVAKLGVVAAYEKYDLFENTGQTNHANAATATPILPSTIPITNKDEASTPECFFDSCEATAIGENVRDISPVSGKGGITARAIVGDGDNRRPHDAYYTPLNAIAALLNVENFKGLTWEPAHGDGRIVRALKQIGCKVIGSDVETGTDFLQTHRKVDNVVTNPPWAFKTDFIRHAKDCSRRKIAMLLPLSALAGVERQPLHEDADFPLRTVYVFVRRLNFGETGGGSVTEQQSSTITPAWFIWEKGYRGETTVKWID